MAPARREVPAQREELVARPVDARIAALAEAQHGVVSRGQLLALGLTSSAIGRRTQSGRLHALHRGVYAVGHPRLSRRGHWMGAVLACGPGAVLSHAAAAALWDLRPSAAVKIDVAVPTAGGRSQRALRVHRLPTLRADEVTAHHGIPATTPSRTILDLAATLDRRGLERLLDRAEELRLFDLAALDALLRAHAADRGASRLGHALRTHAAGSTLTRSELEERFLALCAAAGLTRPRVNHPIGAFTADFLFEAARVVVETDGWTHHRTRRAFEHDRRRDATLLRAGYRTLRFTHRQIEREPRAVAATLGAALSP